MTNIEKTCTTNYQQDMVIRVNNAYQSLDVKKEDYIHAVQSRTGEKTSVLETMNEKNQVNGEMILSPRKNLH